MGVLSVLVVGPHRKDFQHAVVVVYLLLLSSELTLPRAVVVCWLIGHFDGHDVVAYAR